MHTHISDLPRDARALQEEIFGPVLPVFKYRDISEVISFIQQGEKPLVSLITVCVLFVCMYDYYVSRSLVRVDLITLFLPVTVCRYPPYTQFNLDVSMYDGGDEVPAGPSALELLLLLSSEVLQPMFL